MTNLLPKPLANVPYDKDDWRLQASCRGQDPSQFFHPEGERGRMRDERIVLAKEICRTCDVLMRCREWALETNQEYGIWGGMSEAERRSYQRTHSREIAS
jgi:WhiB family redox-sensing transcriptional regulator